MNKRRCIFLGLLFGSAIFSACAADETLQVGGLREPAEILVDRWGVPHIYAKNVDDAFFVQGFNAARDRLFQIDLWRRRGLGELAEVLGESYIEQDRAARLFLYRGDMEKEWAVYGPDSKRIATSFAQGINSYIDWLDANLARMPIEFKALGSKPAKWQPQDVVRIRSHGLTRNLTSEVARANTVCKTNRDNGLKYDVIRSELEPAWESKIPEGLDPCLPADVLKVFTLATQTVRVVKTPATKLAAIRSSPVSLQIALENAPTSEELLEGSNNWVIAPKKSATGRAILANDPHRAYSTPSLRYIAHISAPGMDIVGAGEPALPGISIGHNGTIGFGLTIFNIDQEDLYVYELNPTNAKQYRYAGGWEDMRVVRETVAVKGGGSRAVDLTFTRHGPVIFVDGERRRAYAVRSCWLEPGMAPYFGSIGYMRAKTFSEFKKTMLNWGAPTENQIYADVSGNIGWVPGGLAPIRKNWDGLMPVPGDGRYEWSGFWSGDQLPSAYNPASGYVTTSNELNLPTDYPYRERKLGFEWTNSSRHDRIDEVLKPTSKVTIEQSMTLQNDYTSIPARRLVALLSSLKSADEKTKPALELLRGWNAVLRADSAQAALMELWITRHLGKAFIEAALPKEYAKAITTPDIAVVLAGLEIPTSRFSPNSKDGAIQIRDRILLTSLAAAYAEAEKLLGPDIKKWQWGRLHTSMPEHPLAEFVEGELKAKLQPGPYPTGGSSYTPNQSAYRASDFRLTSGPSFRMVLDIGNWDNSKAVNYPGQSGDPYSSHYRDMVEMWSKGDYVPLLYSRAEIEKATESRIRLMPKPRG